MLPVGGVIYLDEALRIAMPSSLSDHAAGLVDLRTAPSSVRPKRDVLERREEESKEKEKGEGNGGGEGWNPLLVFVTSRLGVDKLNPHYVPHLKQLLASEVCVGILGGRPKASLYFVGYQGDNALYLDPHLVQPAVPEDNDFTEENAGMMVTAVRAL